MKKNQIKGLSARSFSKLLVISGTVFFLILGLSSFIPPAALRSPYANAREGSALLFTGERIKGKFYFHHGPLSKNVQLYYYPEDQRSTKRKYTMGEIRELLIRSKQDSAQFLSFENVNGNLVCRTGSNHTLSGKLFRAI